MTRKIQRLDFKSKAPRHILIIERPDGTFNILEDEESVLRAYRPKRDENISRHRATVRQS